MLSKLWIKPLWWWERNRPYPVRSRVWDLAPIPVSTNAACNLVVLTTPDHAREAAWCAASFLKIWNHPVSLKVVVDGDMGEGDREKLKALFPGIQLRTTREYVDALGSRYPELARLAQKHPMGRKLFAILGAQEESDVIYADDDLLAFDAMPEVNEWLRSTDSPNHYLQDVSQLCAEPTLHATILKNGLPFAPTINVGFLLIRKGSLRGEIAERVLAESGEIHSWFPDTSLLSVMMGHALPLPRERYVVSAARQFANEMDIDYNQISLRHFTRPVRHLMYGRGMPILLEKWGGRR